VRFSRNDQRIDELTKVHIFEDCTNAQLETVARLSDEISLPTNATLMREGRVGRECFILLDGEAVVTIDGKPIAVLGAGDVVGEMAVLEHEPRTATVTAWSPIRALVFTTQEFDSLLDHVPPVAMHVMRALAQRLRAVQAA
jgi:CRP-like cAMP-binding protein